MTDQSDDAVGPDDPQPTVSSRDELADIAAAAGLRAIHVLAWRDLDDPEAGGSEVHAHQVVRRWAAAGLDVTMRTSFAPNRPRLGVRDGYRVIRKAGRYLVFPRAIASEMIGRMGPRDAVVEIWNGVPFLTPLWWHGPRAVWLHHVHGEMWHQIFPPRLARTGEAIESSWAPRFYRRSPIVTLSNSSRDIIAQRMRLKTDRIHVVSPGIDAKFSAGGTKSSHPTVLSVGRLVPVKRLGPLIEMMVTVRERVPDVQLVLVGDGYERPMLEELVARHDAADWIRLPGRISEEQLVDWYRSAWAVVSVSGHEGWGMSITEAAACGTTAVVSDIAGHRDAVVDGVTGLLGVGDDEVADALTRVLTDEPLRHRLQTAARERARHLTWDATAAGTLQVLADDARKRAH
jgi:glycosyltransferase involved in cell wall biosynthesis